MYKVYRCIDGIPQKLLAECATLENACQHAQRLTRAERKPNLEFRILGPSAALPSNQSRSDCSERETPQHIWFRADGSVAPVHAVTNHPGPASPRRQTVAPEVHGSTPNDQMAANNQAVTDDEATGAYYVARYAMGRRSVISQGYKNLDEAHQVARAHMRNPERKPREIYVVIEYALNQAIPRAALPHSTKSLKKRRKRPDVGGYVIACVQPPTHVVVRAGFPSILAAWEAARLRVRMNPRSDTLYFVEQGKVAVPVTDSPYTPANFQVEDEDGEKYPWELEDWRGDMSLMTHRSDELGLGAPAQFGKGRRSRKGSYIP